MEQNFIKIIDIEIKYDYFKVKFEFYDWLRVITKLDTLNWIHIVYIWRDQLSKDELHNSDKSLEDIIKDFLYNKYLGT